MILAIETATPVCSVALGKGRRSVIEKRMEGKGVHSERTFEFIKELLKRHEIGIEDLEAVLFSHGPGSYTGLRIGAAAIKGLLFQKEVPFYTLSTLLSFTVSFLRPGRTVHGVIDARRQHLYMESVKMMSDESIETAGPRVMELKEAAEQLKRSDVVVGTGWERLKMDRRDEIEWHGAQAISAKNLLLGWNHPSIKQEFKKEDPRTFEPNYITVSQINNTPAK
jgi:tRNA threonylcarbamoyladenosine biosynthesis protein TsaB